MSKKINIELTPYQALAIYKFLSEFELDFKTQPLLASLNIVFNEYKKQIFDKITNDHLDDAIIETEINQLMGRDPLSPKNKSENGL